MRPTSARLASHRARAEEPTAAVQDSRVKPPVNPIFMGSWKACMPRKCMDQMPVPMTMEPAAHQASPM